MFFVPPIVIVKIRNIAAVGSIAEHGTQSAAGPGVHKPAMSEGSRITQIKDCESYVLGRGCLQAAQQVTIACRLIDADQNLDCRGQILAEYRAHRPLQAGAEDGWYNHRHIGGALILSTPHFQDYLPTCRFLSPGRGLGDALALYRFVVPGSEISVCRYRAAGKASSKNTDRVTER